MLLGGNPRLSEILKSNARRGGMAGPIFSNDPNIGIRMMGKEAFIPTPLNSMDFHPERTAAVERERKKWYMNTPSFTPSQVLQGAKQGYPDEPTRGDVEDTRPVPPQAVPPKPVVAPPAEKAEPKAADKPSQLDDKKDPMFDSWAREIPSLYQMFTDDEIAKHVDETRRDFGENDVWYKTAKQNADAEMRRRHPPQAPELLAKPSPESTQAPAKPGIPETIARPSDFVGPTGQSVSHKYDFEKPREVSQEQYDMLSKHGPAFELLSQEERDYLRNKADQEEQAARTKRIAESSARAAQAEKEKLIADFMKMMRRQMGISQYGDSEDHDLYRGRTARAEDADLTGYQGVKAYLDALNYPVENFKATYPGISELFGAFANAGRAVSNLPNDLNESLKRTRDRGF